MDPKSVTSSEPIRVTCNAFVVRCNDFGSYVTLFGSICNAFGIQGGTAKNRFSQYLYNYRELENNSFTVNPTFFNPK